MDWGSAYMMAPWSIRSICDRMLVPREVREDEAAQVAAYMRSHEALDSWYDELRRGASIQYTAEADRAVAEYARERGGEALTAGQLERRRWTGLAGDLWTNAKSLAGDAMSLAGEVVEPFGSIMSPVKWLAIGAIAVAVLVVVVVRR